MLSKLIFIIAHQIGNKNFYRLYRKLVRNQSKSYRSLLKDQELSLRRLISFSYNNVPYYRNVFKKLSLLPEDINTISDLEKIPILTKKIINDHWTDLVPINIDQMNYSTLSTGGTSGTPTKYRLSSFDRFFSGAMLYRGWGYGGYKLSDKMIFLGGASLDIGSSRNIMTLLNEFSRNIRKLSSFDMSKKDMYNYVKKINSFRPKYLRGYASSIHYFSNWLQENNIRINDFKAVFTTSDQLFPYMRDRIEDVFDCPVFDGYGLNDGGISAFECEEHNGLHIDMERSVLEVVNNHDLQIDSGEGKILATSLYNYAMPFIRYDSGDLGTTTDEKCSCGRPFPLLMDLKGRSVDLFTTPESKIVHGWFFLYIFWEYNKGILQYQVVQEKIDLIVIYLVTNDQFEDKLLDIITQIIKSKSSRWNVEFKFVDNIPSTLSGKHKFIINKMSAKY